MRRGNRNCLCSLFSLGYFCACVLCALTAARFSAAALFFGAIKGRSSQFRGNFPRPRKAHFSSLAAYRPAAPPRGENGIFGMLWPHAFHVSGGKPLIAGAKRPPVKRRKGYFPRCPQAVRPLSAPPAGCGPSLSLLYSILKISRRYAPARRSFLARTITTSGFSFSPYASS